METWPSALQKYVNQSSFNLKYGPTVLRSDMDVGPAKTRRRTTKSVDPMTASINISRAEYETFDTFYRIMVNGGADRFLFTHPITRNPCVVRFVGEPSIDPLGGNEFVVGFNLEILP